MSEYSQYDHLLSRYLDGSVTADELSQLEARLIADKQFAEYFSRWCLLHQQISEVFTERALHEIMDQFSKGAPGVNKKVLSQLTNNSHKPPDTPTTFAFSGRGSQWFPRWLLGGAAAAVLLLAAWLVGSRPVSWLGDVPTSRDADKPDIVATITQVVDAVQNHITKAAARDTLVLHPGQSITKGNRIALESGMVKVTFECGAEVVLQGPCDFVAESEMIGFLKYGKITANVPHRAFSFAIRSPGVDFVDLGTAFGISVGSGKTQLHVFEGEVLCSQPKKEPAERSDVIHVTADKAVEFEAPGSEPSDIAFNKEQFSRLMSVRRTAADPPKKLVPDRLALWLTADVVTTDTAHRVVAWPDVLYGDNRSAEDATQKEEDARPAFVANAINGHPAVRFNGKSDFLVTTPLETTDNQTVLMVCQFAPTAFDKNRRWGGQILNYDGPPSREANGFLSNTVHPGVLQIGEPLLAEEFKPSLLTGQVFAGFVGSATVESGRVDAKQIGEMPAIVSYVYDYSHGRAVLSINGKPYGESRAFAPQAITSRKIIGRHAWKELFFQGDLAELLIYNKGLSPRELSDTTAYLADKYSIPLDHSGKE
jgi:hypothetical protein